MDGNDEDISIGTRIALNGDGDFRSQECLDILDAADIVVTNGPFSLFNELLLLIVQHNKKYLLIGSINVLGYKGVFPLFKDNKAWFGYNCVNDFIQPDGSVKSFGNIQWITNLEIEKRNIPLSLTQRYYTPDGQPSSSRYPTYCNYNAINVNRIVDIPTDYNGIMGVPISFLNNYNPDQFEIVGMDLNSMVDELGISQIGSDWIKLYKKQGGKGHYTENMHSLVYIVDGKAGVSYKRILIRKKLNT